jgi:hypothetical protein
MLLGHKNLLIFSFSTIVLQKLSRLAYYNMSICANVRVKSCLPV